MKFLYYQRFILLFCIPWLMGCVSENKAIAGRYHYKCAELNCRSPKLKLKRNHRFIYDEPPVHEAKKGFHQKGTWSYLNDTLTLRFDLSEYFNDLQYVYDSTINGLAFKQDTFGWMVKGRK